MCRNIWTHQIENEIFSAFGRDYLDLDINLPEMLLAPGSLEKHKPLYTAKLSDCVDPAYIERFDKEVKSLAAVRPDRVRYIENSSIGNFYLNVMLFLQKHPSEECDKKELCFFVSIEDRADPENPLSVVGDTDPEYAIYTHTFRASSFYEPKDRNKMIREGLINIAHQLTAEFVEFELREAADAVDYTYLLALPSMLEEI